MAVYFRHTCGNVECGKPVATDNKVKAYVHADRNTKFDHDVTTVITTKLGIA